MWLESNTVPEKASTYVGGGFEEDDLLCKLWQLTEPSASMKNPSSESLWS